VREAYTAEDERRDDAAHSAMVAAAAAASARRPLRPLHPDLLSPTAAASITNAGADMDPLFARLVALEVEEAASALRGDDENEAERRAAAAAGASRPHPTSASPAATTESRSMVTSLGPSAAAARGIGDTLFERLAALEKAEEESASKQQDRATIGNAARNNVATPAAGIRFAAAGLPHSAKALAATTPESTAAGSQSSSSKGAPIPVPRAACIVSSRPLTNSQLHPSMRGAAAATVSAPAPAPTETSSAAPSLFAREHQQQPARAFATFATASPQVPPPPDRPPTFTFGPGQGGPPPAGVMSAATAHMLAERNQISKELIPYRRPRRGSGGGNDDDEDMFAVPALAPRQFVAGRGAKKQRDEIGTIQTTPSATSNVAATPLVATGASSTAGERAKQAQTQAFSGEVWRERATTAQ